MSVSMFSLKAKGFDVSDSISASFLGCNSMRIYLSPRCCCTMISVAKTNAAPPLDQRQWESEDVYNPVEMLTALQQKLLSQLINSHESTHGLCLRFSIILVLRKDL